MNSFEPGFLERLPIPHNLLRTVRLLGEYKGKEDLFRQQSPQVLKSLQHVAVIQSTESSNRIEGVVAPLKRIQDLVDQKTTPRSRSEQEIAGYRDVLNTIHTDPARIPFTPGVVQQLHRDLFKYTPSPGGQWKSLDNEIAHFLPDGTKVLRFQPVPAIHTPEAMEKLHTRFREHWEAGEIEPLLLIAAYLLDFLCIHPFSDGNGRMARLLGLLLLYRAGFEVGRYISLEKIVEESRESYYDSLYASSQGWHDAKHDLLPWSEYFLGVLVAAYRKFEERAAALEGPRGSKTQMVLEAVRNMPDGFRMADLERACPGVSRDMLRVVINDLKRTGAVWREGTGRGAVWRKHGNNG
jgi:Fic family protein